jgi:hypothetical protein
VNDIARRPGDPVDGFFELRYPPPEAAELIRSVAGLLQLAIYAIAPMISDESATARGRAGLALAALREVLYDLRALSAALGTEHGVPVKGGRQLRARYA